MKKLCSLMVLSISLGACSAVGPKYSSVHEAIPDVAEPNGRVIYYRTYQAFGAGMKQSILLDNKIVGDSQVGGMFIVNVSPGDHISKIEHKFYPGQSTVKFTVEPGQTTYIETWVGGSGFVGRINQTLRPAKDAVPLLNELSVTGGL